LFYISIYMYNSSYFTHVIWYEGKVHHDIHTWWHDPMKELIGYWMKLEERTKLVIDTLKDASGSISGCL